MDVEIFQTDFLVARPSTLAGAASVIDLFGVFDSHNISPTPADADRRAAVSDWIMAFGDLRAAAESYLRQIEIRDPGIAGRIREQLRAA